MNVLYAVRKSDETNQLLKNGQVNKNTCGKENEGEGNDQVTNQQQHTVDKENIYDHMSNLF
jgi:hypothetical protein